jgi:hypothetical protein
MLTETEILDRHRQALGEAHRACQALGRNADPTYIAPRGAHYTRLKEAVERLEGSARQMAHWREDARWLRLGIFYGGPVLRMAQKKYVGQRWNDFNKMREIFDRGLREFEELATRKVAKAGPILPSRPLDWLILPDHRVPQPNRGTMH